MEAPEKIYVTIHHPFSSEYTEIIAFEEGDGIEYCRTDAFIEKACAWLDENLIYYWEQLNVDDTAELLDDFKKAMSV